MQSLIPFRWLALVCVVAIAVGFQEYNRRRVDIYGDAQHNYPEAMATLYPGIAQTEYLAGRKAEVLAGSGADPREIQQRPELLEKFLADLHQQLEEARGHYERALAAGLRSEENLQYNYALTLMRLRADPEQIDRAIANWRRDFPHSTLRDLQSRWLAIQEEQSNLDQLLGNLREERELQKQRQELERMYGPSRPRGSQRGE